LGLGLGGSQCVTAAPAALALYCGDCGGGGIYEL
jgi:hypothetical protein